MLRTARIGLLEVEEVEADLARVTEAQPTVAWLVCAQNSTIAAIGVKIPNNIKPEQLEVEVAGINRSALEVRSDATVSAAGSATVVADERAGGGRRERLGGRRRTVRG